MDELLERWMDGWMDFMESVDYIFPTASLDETAKGVGGWVSCHGDGVRMEGGW